MVHGRLCIDEPDWWSETNEKLYYVKADTRDSGK